VDRIINRLGAGLAVMGLIVGLWSGGMWNVYYGDGLHRRPDRAAGRVHVENMHGVPLYTDNREHFILDDVPYLSIGLIGLAGLLHWAQERRVARRSRIRAM